MTATTGPAANQSPSAERGNYPGAPTPKQEGISNSQPLANEKLVFFNGVSLGT